MSSKPFQHWQVHSARCAPSIVGVAPSAAAELAYQTAREAGYAAGLEQGMVAGRQRGDEQQAADSARLVALLDSLAVPLANLEQELLDSVLQLACALAKQVVRRELTAVPARIGELVREGVAALPPTAREITIYLNPLDLDLVRSTAPRGRNDARWELLADPSLERGGCRINTSSSEVDLTLETRLAEVFARLMEGDGS